MRFCHNKGVTRFTDDRTPVPNDRRPAKAELDKRPVRMIARDTLLRVRETARIDEVAAGYLTLRRSGKDLVALCPFHDERHPSFRISPALNIGKCFSCGEAADPIRLVRHMEGCGFEEAVRLLARKYGIEVEEERGTEEAGRHEARQAILRGNEAFARSLLPTIRRGDNGRGRERRGRPQGAL